jgi:hypothetical protein
MLDQIALFAREQTMKHENAEPFYSANPNVGRFFNSYDTPKELLLRSDYCLKALSQRPLRITTFLSRSAFGAGVRGG